MTEVTRRLNQLQALRERLMDLREVREHGASTVELDQTRTGRLSRMDALQRQAVALRPCAGRRPLKLSRPDASTAFDVVETHRSRFLEIGSQCLKELQTMSDMTIHVEGDASRGRYVARVAGIDAEAELTFSSHGPGLISADHTGAPSSLRGTGAAAALVDRLVNDARRKGFKIIPHCSYVRARYEKHPDWSDVFTVGPGEEPASD